MLEKLWKFSIADPVKRMLEKEFWKKSSTTK